MMFRLGNGPRLLTGDDPPSETPLRFWEHRYYPISARTYLDKVHERNAMLESAFAAIQDQMKIFNTLQANRAAMRAQGFRTEESD